MQTAGAPAPAPAPARLNLDQPWELASQVALRTEAFGALAYHFGDRRLSFLTSPRLVTVVRTLDGLRTLREVLDAEVPDPSRRAIEKALASLAAADVIREVTA